MKDIDHFMMRCKYIFGGREVENRGRERDNVDVTII